MQSCQPVLIFHISYGNLSKIRLSGHVKINTEFWKTTTRNAQKQWTPTSMQRPINLHRIPALSVQAAYALTHLQAAQRGCCDERTARGTSCYFVALYLMHAQSTSPRSMHAHSTSPHSMHAHETTDQNLRWRQPLQPFNVNIAYVRSIFACKFCM